jgi:Fungal specific transcription factor domain
MLSLCQQPSAIMDNGFSLSRLDPLEIKRNQIIEVLKRSEPLDSENTTYPYITRQNMVHLCHLYGKHFQHNLPIIHAPTFNMIESPPILLLAIMLVGACYSKGSIPPVEVIKLAMRLLTSIAAEPVSCPSVLIPQDPPANLL